MVDNIPKVPQEKLEKLMNVIDRIFGQIGSVKEGQALSHPGPPPACRLASS